MSTDLSFDLHALTARLDRAADRILSAEFGLSYRRFLTLVVLDQLGSATQRKLAEALGVSEPSLSRMAAVLARAELVELGLDPGGGNKRRLSLTPAGKTAVESGRDLLEGRFASLVEASGVPYEVYAAHTKALLAALRDYADTAPDPRGR